MKRRKEINEHKTPVHFKHGTAYKEDLPKRYFDENGNIKDDYKDGEPIRWDINWIGIVAVLILMIIGYFKK